MVEMAEVRAEPRSPVPLVCAVVGLAALAAAQLNLLGQIWFIGLVEDATAVYVTVAVLVLALLAWHRWPRRSWSVLLIVGAVAALPTPVFWLAQDSFAEWMVTPYLVVSSSSVPLLLVGTLGAATATWRTGRRGAGAALLGATLAMRPLTAFSLIGLLVDDGKIVAVIVLGILVLTVLAAVAAFAGGPAPVEPEARPGWPVTIGGALAGAAPAVVYQVWQRPDKNDSGLGIEGYYDVLTQHYLAIGLVITAVGVLGGALGGLRVLVSGVAAGLLLGALSSLVLPAAVSTGDLADGVPALLAVAVLVASVFVAMWRGRLVVGVAGLGLLVAGLLVVWANLRADDPFLTADVADLLTPVLVVVAIIASTSTLASLGAGLASPGEAPAAFAGVAAAVTLGATAVINHFTFGASVVGPERAGSYPPAIVFLVVAIALTVLAHHRWQEREVPATGMPAGPR